MGFDKKWTPDWDKQKKKSQKSEPFDDKLNTSLHKNLQQIKKIIGHSNDIIIREIKVGKLKNQLVGIIYTDGLADQSVVSNFIMESLMLDIESADIHNSGEIIQFLKDYCLTIGDIKDISSFTALYNSILNGDTVILLDGYTKGISTSTTNANGRAISEPANESVIRGPREAFTETIRTNTALIRRKIKDPNLWLKSKTIGKYTKTDVSIMYINGIANDKVVTEVMKRLDRIDIDGILESGYIEELIQDSTLTPFPTVYNTERPDVIAAQLLEGKVAILVDGTPFVLIVPAPLTSFLQAAEDHYQRSDISSLIRIMRYLGIGIALLGPSFYVAISTHHQEMLPTPMLLSLAAQREGVPFPAFAEALIMEVAFEILREAGIRMPRTIGPAVSIVGTLVIGQAAVEAGIVSAVMVIVVSITAICSFLFPSYSLSNTFRLLRFPMMGLAAFWGLFGVMAGITALILHLCSLRSFGVPYMSPFAPFIPSEQKDSILRFPRWALLNRSRLLSPNNIKRGSNPLNKPTKGRK
ncbi:spore gernimation protein KA [Lysinibacillus sphaericus]|nr:spore germination protein [Lysinibacillus sphaericus]KEK09334.1 spore gernimation protein KA [Lysinibacillus sphaericus]